VHLARSAGLPIVVKVHGCDVLCGGRGLHSDRGRLVKTVQCLCAADAVVAVSRDLARNVASLGVPAERIHTVYNGVDSRIFHSGPADAARAKLELPDGERIILFVGRFDPVKGLDVLLKSCVLLMATGLRFKCYLVGDGPLRAELTAQVAALGLRDVVVMPGARDQAQLGDWYRSADVVVLPSRSEGVPNVLLEAAACGASFVASRVGGIEEIADRVPSRLVPPCDASALCHAIQELLVHRPAMKRLPAAPPRGHLESARELAALFDLVKHGHRYAAHAMPQTAMGGICNPTPENA
jgi:glycosyltransferase involved in cell wall biosynthesis